MALFSRMLDGSAGECVSLWSYRVICVCSTKWVSALKRGREGGKGAMSPPPWS